MLPWALRRYHFVLLVLTVLSISHISAIGLTHAQQDFGIREAFGIPVVNIAVTVVLILALYGGVIVLVKQPKSQIIMGGIVTSVGVLIIVMLSPVFMWTQFVGSDFSYCKDNSCNDAGIANITGYQDVSAYPTLNKALNSPGVGTTDCCRVQTINYLEELSLYPLLSSTVQLDTKNSFDNAYLVKFRGDLYTVSFHHLDDDYNYTTYGTVFTLDAFYLITVVPALAFFSVVLPTKSARIVTTNSKESRITSRSLVVIRWLSNRRISIPLIGIAVFVSTLLVSLGLGSDHHQSTWDILFKASFSLAGFIGVNVAARIVDRSRTMSQSNE